MNAASSNTSEGDYSVSPNSPIFTGAPTDQHLLSIVINNMSEGVCLIRANDNSILYANPKFERIFGYSPGELNGQPVSIINYKGGNLSSSSQVKTITDLIRLHGEYSYEAYNVKKDGTPFWCKATTSLFEHPEHGLLYVAVQQDIDDRKRIEKALQESEQRFKAIFNQTFQFIGLLSPAGILLEANQTALNFGGLTREEVVGRPFWEARWWTISDATQQQLKGAIVRAAQGEFVRYEVRVRGADATSAIIDFSLSPIKGENGEVVLLIPEGRNITEKKAYEEALQRSENIYRNLVRNLPDISVLLFDTELRYIVAEGIVPHHHPFNSAFIEGKTIWEVLPAKEASRQVHHYQAALSGIEYSYEDYFEDRVYQVKAVPLKDQAGNIFAGMILTQDITQLKQAELRAIGEKEQLSITLRSIGDGVITTDLAAKVLLINRAAEELTGWSQTEVVGRPIEEILNIVNEKTGLPVENPVHKVLKEGQTVLLANHTRLVSRNGTGYSIADSSAPVRDQSGNITGTVLVFHDVTHQRWLAEEQLKISKLEALGVLAGGIAHDFNNMLAVIIANIDLSRLLVENNGKLHNVERILNHLNEAEKAAMRSKDITSQLLTFSRGGTPIKKTTQLPLIVQEAANFALHGANVRCDFNLNPSLWMVSVDEGQIGQVIQNLILNAVQAMPDGGLIEVSGENLTLDQDAMPGLAAGNYVRLAVKDNGIGIRQEDFGRIFDPYFTTKATGSGLGLAVCFSIVKKHDGLITVESQPGAGSTFNIYLPAVAVTGQVIKPVQPVLTPGFGRILVMDDEPMILETVELMLNKLGYGVSLAAEGQTVLRLYQEALEEGRPFDLVLLDLTIPGGMGGKQTMQHLLEIDPQAKVVVCSGYSNDEIMAKYADYGFAGVLPKPYRMADLSRMVQNLILK